MAFGFKRKESVSKAIRRLGRERIEHALKCLKNCDRAEAIHCARKDIKKVRAILRLVRSRIAKKKFSRLTNLLRQLATHLAAPRDAYIKAKVLQDLAPHLKGQLAPAALRHVRAELRNGFDEEMRRFGKAKTARAVERTVNRVVKELKHLDINGKGWKALSPGLKTAFGQAQRACQTVLKDSSSENFHEWRKRAKDLWCQVTVLHAIWPEQMDAMASELETIGEYLGDDHDLVLLRHAIEEQGAAHGNARELESFYRLVEQRQGELRAAALAAGARFFAEKPSMFCNRLAGYWRTWRREKMPIAQAVDATR